MRFWKLNITYIISCKLTTNRERPKSAPPVCLKIFIKRELLMFEKVEFSGGDIKCRMWNFRSKFSQSQFLSQRDFQNLIIHQGNKKVSKKVVPLWNFWFLEEEISRTFLPYWKNSGECEKPSRKYLYLCFQKNWVSIKHEGIGFFKKNIFAKEGYPENFWNFRLRKVLVLCKEGINFFKYFCLSAKKHCRGLFRV